MKQTKELLNLVKDKLSKDDLVDIILDLQSEVDDLNTANQSWKDEQAKNRSLINEIEGEKSLAWGEHTKSQKRVAQLFGQFERIARILNQTDDVDGVNDTQIIEQIVEVVENEIEIVGGEFVNHKGETL